MKCTNHSKKASTGSCVECGRLYCDECIIKVGKKRYCKECSEDILTKEEEETNTTSSNNNTTSSHSYKHGNIIITQQTTNNNNNSTEATPVSNPVAVRIAMWIISIFFFLGGLGYLFRKPMVAIFSICIALLWLPPLNDWLEKEKKIIISSSLRIVISIILLFLMGITMMYH